MVTLETMLYCNKMYVVTLLWHGMVHGYVAWCMVNKIKKNKKKLKKTN